MIKILSGYSLHANNSFKLQASADYYVECSSISEIQDFIHTDDIRDKKVLILGEGSNILFTGDYKGIVLRPVIDSIEETDKKGDRISIRSGAGVHWDGLVEWTVSHGYWGLENLSLIPGSVGAAPVQNIGAYGVELKESVESVESFDLQTGKNTVLSAEECRFGYRNSIFKTEPFRNHVITYLNLTLSAVPRIRNTYGDLAEELKSTGDQGIQNIRDTIIRIRKQKLPDPVQTGNAGSFFKNPVIPYTRYEVLRESFPAIPFYPVGEKQVKIPAAWLIEQAGWKGKRIGDAGTWPTQPLVIINHGRATGQEILEFSKKIRAGVQEKFGIILEREVNIV
jgi:UDP-N-acetylmuramate dehydrogenase